MTIKPAKIDLDDFININPDLFYVNNHEGNLIKWNKAVEDLTGLGPDELMNRPAVEFVVEEDRDALLAAMNEVFEVGFGSVEARFISKDGSLVPFLCNGTALKNKQGEIIGFTGTGRNISDRVELEAKREKTLKRQHALNQLQAILLGRGALKDKLKLITDQVVSIFQADFCRIWITRPGDKCESGCIHHLATTGSNLCQLKDKCLHLVASSGRYRNIDGTYQRMPFGVFKIGRLAMGPHTKFLTNNVKTDTQIHDRDWAAKLGLKSFAGYQLRDVNGEPVGVLALFSKHEIEPEDDFLLESLGNSTAQVIRTSTAEESLQESEEKYRKIFNNEIDAICVFDIETRKILDVNDAFLNQYKYTRDEVLQLTIDNISSEPEKSKEAVEKAAKDGNTLIPIRYHQASDGTQIIVEISAGPFTWKGQNVMYAVVRNITEHIKAKEALSRSEKKYRNLFHYSNDGIYVHDMDGRIIEVNQKALEQSGLTRDEILSSRITDLLPPESAKKTNLFIQDMDQQGFVNYELFAQKKNGEQFPVECSSSLLDLEGEKIVQTVVRDISERKKLEEELLKIEKLKSTGVLAGGIAHDFNNLLMAILGNISIARLNAALNSKVTENLTEAERALNRAQALTQQLLTFSKGGKPIKKPAFISDVAQESISFALSGSNVKSNLTITENLWPVLIDENQISQVIQNMITNADQAMPGGGVVTISMQNKQISKKDALPLKEGRYVEISITDTGEGIKEKNIARVFDPYFSTKKGGSGLGLASAYSIIKNHDGFITVDSIPATGSTFHIYLPVSEELPSPQKPTPIEPISGTGKILIMDDDSSVARVAADMLSLMGYSVEIASAGDEAITLYEKASRTNMPFDAVILDLTIPGGMGGKETIEKLLEIDPDVKAIVSSGYANDPIMANYKSYGFSSAIAKPYAIQNLNKVLQRLLIKKI